MAIDDKEIAFEEEPQVEEELHFLQEGEEAPGVGNDELDGVTKEELWERLKKAEETSSSNQAIREGLTGLSDKLNRPAQVVQQQAPQASQESEEEYFDRMGDEIFKADKPGNVLKDIAKRVKQEMAAQYAQHSVMQQKEIMRLSPKHAELFNKYEDEIEAKRRTLTPAQQADPRSYEWAMNEVRNNHFDEIVAEQVAKQLEAQQQPKNDERRHSTVTRGTFTESSSVAAPRPKAKKVYVSAAKKKFADQIAIRKGLPVEVVIRQINEGVIAWKEQ